jgi:hypothetical protein
MSGKESATPRGGKKTKKGTRGASSRDDSGDGNEKDQEEEKGEEDERREKEARGKEEGMGREGREGEEKEEEGEDDEDEVDDDDDLCACWHVLSRFARIMVAAPPTAEGADPLGARL